jgi:4-hydroxy-3-methylbut-2-enyl diphosphate reductase
LDSISHSPITFPSLVHNSHQDFGFCWGVERSIALAYEAVNHFPDRKVHITNELIHNPEVNDNLNAMNVQFIKKIGDGKKDYESVQDGDVVILPAFGASLEEMDYFNKKVCIAVL